MDNLFDKNVYHVIINIFIELSPKDLHICRQVCKKWNTFIKENIWFSKKYRPVLNKRLERRWQDLEYIETELQIDCLDSQSGVKILGDHIIIHPQLYISANEHKLLVLHSKTGQIVKEREFQGVLESVDIGSSFIVLGLTELQYSTRNPSQSADWLEVLSIPGCKLLSRLTLPAEQSKELFCVQDETIIFLRGYKESLDCCEFVLLKPLTKEKKDFLVKISFADVVCLRFDGRYALVKTIDKVDRITVFDTCTKQCVVKGLPAADFKLNEIFRYPLSISIEDRCNINVINVKTRSRSQHFIHRDRQEASSEIGLLNRMLIAESGYLLVSRYEKFRRSDHSNCYSQMIGFKLDDIKYGIYSPVTINIRDSGPLFDGFHASNNRIVAIYSAEKKIRIFNFWS